MAKHERRTPEQLIQDLEARIHSIRARAERKQAKQDPAIRNALLAVKVIDKAIAADPPAWLRVALHEARGTLSESLGTKIVMRPVPTPDAPPAPKRRRRTKEPVA